MLKLSSNPNPLAPLHLNTLVLYDYLHFDGHVPGKLVSFPLVLFPHLFYLEDKTMGISSTGLLCAGCPHFVTEPQQQSTEANCTVLGKRFILMIVTDQPIHHQYQSPNTMTELIRDHKPLKLT